jgi:hypothetical protein
VVVGFEQERGRAAGETDGTPRAEYVHVRRPCRMNGLGDATNDPTVT